MDGLTLDAVVITYFPKHTYGIVFILEEKDFPGASQKLHFHIRRNTML